MYYIITIGIVLLLVGVNKILNVYQSDAEKIGAFECGIKEQGDARQKFDITFYVIAILFLIFDLEIVLLYPYATIYGAISWYGYWGFIVLLTILTVGLAYELMALAK